MLDDTSTRFKSRFSITSLLPARHTIRRIPPPLPSTQTVSARQPTIISLTETEVSPIDSEHPLSAYSPPILPPNPPYSSPALNSRSSASFNSPRSTLSSKKTPHRPPPLDLTRTKQVYPGVAGVVPTAGTIAPKMRRKETLPPRKESKQAKKAVVLDDPFDIAEVEPGHRYTSWRGGRVSIKPGQIIPQGLLPPKDSPTLRGVDPRFSNLNMVSLNSPGVYDSVLHDVVLTPTYLRRSPCVPPTPSPCSSAGEGWPNRRPSRQKTLLNAIKRRSRMLQRDNAHERSVNHLKDREAAQITKFRMATRPVRIAETEPKAYSTHSPMLHPGPFAYSRRSPASREWNIGVTLADREKKHRGDDGKLWTRRKEEEEEQQQKKRKHKVWKWIILFAVIGLIALTVGLCISLLAKSHEHSSSPANGVETASTSDSLPSAAPTPSTAPSRTLSTCLDLFATSAPTSPLSFPCSDCVPLMRSTTNDYSYPLNNGNASGVGAALQFCALSDVYRSTSSNGLHEKGWMLDASPCSWDGITCDDRGRVTELQLRYPDVPDRVPESLSALIGLQTLRVMGNNTVPAGNFPSALLSLPNISSIDIEYTALTGAISSIDFSKAPGLTSLVLVNNAQIGNALPLLNKNTELKTLAVTGQQLANVSELNLPTSLTYLDLSYNVLTGQIPSLSTLTALQTLYLSNNNYTAPPASLPSSLSSLSLTGNANLQGFMPQSVCSASALTSCDLRSTNLMGPNMIPGAMSGIFIPTAATNGPGPMPTTVGTGQYPPTGKVCGSCRLA